MDSAFWVLCNRGSGSWERCIHSGILIVPPSRSAMITSSCKQKPKPNQKLPNESWSNVTRIWPPVLQQIEKCLSVKPWAHQLLDLALEHGVHSDDKGRRRAQHLQQSRWEDGNVGVAVVQIRVRKPPTIIMSSKQQMLTSDCSHYIPSTKIVHTVEKTLKIERFAKLYTYHFYNGHINSSLFWYIWVVLVFMQCT